MKVKFTDSELIEILHTQGKLLELLKDVMIQYGEFMVQLADNLNQLRQTVYKSNTDEMRAVEKLDFKYKDFNKFAEQTEGKLNYTYEALKRIQNQPTVPKRTDKYVIK